MKTIKRSLRILFYIFLMVLASVGIGLAGAVPLNSDKRKSLMQTNDIEHVEKEKKKDQEGDFIVG